MPVFSPIDLVGCTFLIELCEDGQCFHAQIVKAIEDHENKLAHHPEHLKFLCSINDDAAEEIMSYNDILAHIQWDEDSNIDHPSYKGSSYNVLLEWEMGRSLQKPSV